MFSTIYSVFGHISVFQDSTRIIVTGIRSYRILKEINKLLGTSRVASGMFYTVTGSRIEIPLFFAFDFLVLIRLLKENPTQLVSPEMYVVIEEKLIELPIFLQTKKIFPSKLNKKCLDVFTVSPLPKQADFFPIYDQDTQRYGMKGYILASAAGTGKTLTSLFLSEMLESEVTIVFSPSNALENVWDKTFKTFYKKIPITYVYGQKLPEGPKRYYVFSHDNMKFAKEFIEKNLKNKKINIIIDECQAFTTLTSDRTLLLIEICKLLKCENVLFMSGTPFKALGAEVIPFLKCADPYFVSTSEERFKKVFGVSGTRALNILSARIGRSMYKVEKSEVVNNVVVNIDLKVTVPNGERFTMDKIRTKMEKFVTERVNYYKFHRFEYDEDYIRIVKIYEDSLKDKTSLMKLNIYKKEIELIRKSKDLRVVKEEIMRCNSFERKELIPNLPSGLKDRFRDCRSVYKYVALKIQGEALGRILGKERLECNLAILENISNAKIYCEDWELNGESWELEDIFASASGKTVFFTDYVEVVQLAESLFKEMKMTPGMVYADTNKDLTSTIARFEKDPKLNPLIATFKSLSTAVPLIMADTIVMLNVPYRDYIYTQSVARLDRLGQKNTVKIYHAYLDTGELPNISTRSKEIMSWSKEMVSILMNGGGSDDPDIVLDSFMENFVTETKNILQKVPSWDKW